ncbi:P-loop containing nucleoside triphosphate hydrolase protein [Leptodontidium sp. 2 PMI_412]|nr:P-loop containing nucleoside triphosphate hydrolase protein [Leptodontidium sp. 2 PMI_412]
MSGSLPMPGAWNSMWESPVATTQDREAPVPLLGMGSGTVPIQAPTQHRSSLIRGGRVGPPPPPSRPPVREVPLPTNLAPLPPARAAPIPMRQVTFPRTWDNDYNPDPAAEVPEDAPGVREPSSRYALFADASDTGENSDIAEENKPPIVIAVFGQTGTGKTSFIKAVTGKDLQIGHSLTSCTEDVLAVPCRIDNENVMLVDTPGFSDTNFSDTEILRRIAAWMKDTYDDGFLLSGIIYLHRIIDPRMEGPSLKNLRMMKKLCGANSLSNVVLATTIITTETGHDARALVKSLLKNKPISTRLQEELHSGKTLVQTEAGVEIREEIAKLERKLKAEHEIEMRELEVAQRDRNRELARQIRAEMVRNNLRIARLEAEKKELENSAPKTLPKAKREGLFGWGSYRCLFCDKKTSQCGRWTCKSCNHQ